MSKITVALQAIAWAALGYFGITKLDPNAQQIVTPAVTIISGFIGPALIEWGTRTESFVAKHRNELASAASIGAGIVAYLVAHQHMNQRLAGVLTAVVVAATHLFVPSSAHPSRLP